MKRWTVRLVVLVAVLVATASFGPKKVWGGIIVDQSNFCCSSGGEGIVNDDTFPFTYREVAQTFVIANSGTLQAFDFLGGAQATQYTGNLLAYVVPVVGNAPVTDLSLALDSASIFLPQNTIGGNYQMFTVSGFSLPVAAGDVLAVVLAAELKPGGTTAFSVSRSSFDYTSGSTFSRVSKNTIPLTPWSGNQRDLVFRTYVDCADPSCTGALDPSAGGGGGGNVVPEPTTLAIWSILGGIGLVAGRWRRRRKAV